jgi:hypothetical protein
MRTIRLEDYPLCPYCKSKVFVFNPPGKPENINIYCSSSECKGIARSGVTNGYDIMLSDITSPLTLNKNVD